MNNSTAPDEFDRLVLLADLAGYWQVGSFSVYLKQSSDSVLWYCLICHARESITNPKYQVGKEI